MALSNMRMGLLPPNPTTIPAVGPAVRLPDTIICGYCCPIDRGWDCATGNGHMAVALAPVGDCSQSRKKNKKDRPAIHLTASLGQLPNMQSGFLITKMAFCSLTVFSIRHKNSELLSATTTTKPQTDFRLTIKGINSKKKFILTAIGLLHNQYGGLRTDNYGNPSEPKAPNVSIYKF